MSASCKAARVKSLRLSSAAESQKRLSNKAVTSKSGKAHSNKNHKRKVLPFRLFATPHGHKKKMTRLEKPTLATRPVRTYKQALYTMPPLLLDQPSHTLNKPILQITHIQSRPLPSTYAMSQIYPPGFLALGSGLQSSSAKIPTLWEIVAEAHNVNKRPLREESSEGKTAFLTLLCTTYLRSS